jgi:ribosome-binding factor A
LAPQLIIFEPEHGLVSITEVRVLEDLSQARIYVFCQTSLTSLVEKLNARAGHFAREISAQMTQKKTPRIRFFADEAMFAARKIDELLAEDAPKKNI